MTVDGRRIGGGSATVAVQAQRVVDAPTRHAGEMSAGRPPSGLVGGGSTTVNDREDGATRFETLVDPRKGVDHRSRIRRNPTHFRDVAQPPAGPPLW
jgi:hypothetical protein